MPSRETKALIRSFVVTLKLPIQLQGSYFLWTVIARLLIVSFTTYFAASSNGGDSDLQDVTDLLSSSEIPLTAVSAFLFLQFRESFRSLGEKPLKSSWLSSARLHSQFSKGCFQGMGLSALLASVFLASGLFTMLGWAFQPENYLSDLCNSLLQASSLVLLCYCEGLFFYEERTRGSISESFIHAIITSGLYCLTKSIQFDPPFSEQITLFLISMILCFSPSTLVKRSIGVFSGALMMIHSFLSFPIFGNDVSGLLLIRSFSEDSILLRPLSGEIGGPLSSAIAQVFLLIFLSRSILRKIRLQQEV